MTPPRAVSPSGVAWVASDLDAGLGARRVQLRNLRWAARQALNLIVTAGALIAVLAFINRLAGLAFPGFVQ